MVWEGAVCPIYGDGDSRATTILSPCSSVHRSTDESLEFSGAVMPGRPLASELSLGMQTDEPWSEALEAEKNLVVSSEP